MGEQAPLPGSGATDCKDVAKPQFEGAQASRFSCGAGVGDINVFDTDEHFKAAVATPAGDWDAVRVSNKKTRTLLVVAGAIGKADADAICKVIGGDCSAKE